MAARLASARSAPVGKSPKVRDFEAVQKIVQRFFLQIGFVIFDIKRNPQSRKILCEFRRIAFAESLTKLVCADKLFAFELT